MSVFRVTRMGLAAALALCLLPAPGQVWARDREAARQAWQKARDYHDRLLAMPEGERTRKLYSRAIYRYRTVIDHDPVYSACDDALFFIGTLYEEMAGRFASPEYRRKAIYYYEFVAEQYSTTKHRSAALQRAALLRAEALSAGARPGPNEAETRQSADPHAPPATVSEIRYWSNQDYTRVVIQLDREVEFEKHLLEDPDRIYFDLSRARLKPELVGKTYQVNDLFIKQIRVAQNRPQRVRVVLDFEKINRHSVFALYDPYRIVIDTMGGRPGADRKPVRTEEAVITLDEPARGAGPPGEEAPKDVVEAAPVVPTPNRAGDRTLTRVLGLKVGRVVIDPGHGGSDTGTIGASGLREKDLVLSIGLRLKELLEERLGTEVVLTRKEDTFVPLEERTAIANQMGADLFISIHANAYRNRKVSGVETFFQGFTSNASEREVASRENATSQRNIRELEDILKRIALGEHNEESSDFAHVVQNQLFREIKPHRPGVRNRGVKKAPFVVLIGLNMPGILVEVGFISNPADERFFTGDSGRDQTAEALYAGVAEYLRSLGTLPLEERAASGGAPPN